MTNVTQILAIDPGLHMGWAFNDGMHGVELFQPKPRESTGMKFVRFRAWLVEVIEKLKPDLVVFEATHTRYMQAAASGFGFSAHIEAICSEHAVDYTAVQPGEVKKHATGNGRANKKQMLEAARARWNGVSDDNEADALWILDYARERFQ